MAGYKKQFESMGFGYDELTANGYNKINGVCFTVNLNPNTKDYNEKKVKNRMIKLI